MKEIESNVEWGDIAEEFDIPTREDIVTMLELANVESLQSKMVVSQMLQHSTGKGLESFPGLLVHTLTEEVAKSMKMHEYMVARKIDGIRVMIIYVDGVTYFLFRDNTLWMSKTGTTTHTSFVVEGEVVFEGDILVFYMFDAMYLNGERKINFVSHRLSALYSIVDDFTFGSMVVREQEYFQYRLARRRMMNDWEGLIFVKANSEYFASISSPVVYKYVVPSRLTIDLKVVSGAAYTFDNYKMFSCECKDGVYEFNMKGIPIRPRFKVANNKFVVDITRSVMSFSPDRLDGAIMHVPKRKMVSSYNVLTNKYNTNIIARKDTAQVLKVPKPKINDNRRGKRRQKGSRRRKVKVIHTVGKKGNDKKMWTSGRKYKKKEKTQTWIKTRRRRRFRPPSRDDKCESPSSSCGIKSRASRGNGRFVNPIESVDSNG
jgi:hypothetical protein